MSNLGGRGLTRQSGQIMIPMVVLVLLLLLLAAIPVDGGLGLVLIRQTQNGADAAAQAAAAALAEPCSGNAGVVTGSAIGGMAPANNPNLWGIIPQVLYANTPSGSASLPNWSAEYLNNLRQPIPGTTFNAYPPLAPPVGACGVSITVGATRSNIIAGLFGAGTLSTQAKAAAIVLSTGGVQALAQYGRHTFYAKGVGELKIDGNLYIDSFGCQWVAAASPLTQPDSQQQYPAEATDGQSACDDIGNSGAARSVASPGLGQGPLNCDGVTGCWGEDTIDSYEDLPGRSISTTGTIYSATARPLDPAFYCYGSPGYHQKVNPNPPPALGAYAVRPADPASTPCSSGSSDTLNEDVYFQAIKTGHSLPDPLAATQPPSLNPLDYCPSPTGGNYTAASPGSQIVGTQVQFNPGTYNYPVVIGGIGNNGAPTSDDIVLNGCGQYPGIYNFQQGVEICPEYGNSVTAGSAGVMLYSGGPFGGVGPLTGPVTGCPGEGKATPFIDTTLATDPMHFCPPRSASVPGGVMCYENDDQVLDAGYYGSGTYGITIGGHGHVTLSAPTSGPYQGILLFQDRADGDLLNPSTANGTSFDSGGANIGLDPYPGERADPPGYDPDCHEADITKPCYDDPTYHDNFYLPSSTPAVMPDNASITLTGIVYDAYAPLTFTNTAHNAPQLAKFACFGSESPTTGLRDPDPTSAPACYLRDTGDGPANQNQPTPGASLPPAALYAAPADGSTPYPPSCAFTVAPALCQHQLTARELWRVVCDVTPATNAGRIQIGQSTCSDDPQETQTYFPACKSTSPNSCGDVTITGAAIADVFSTTGWVNASIDVQTTDQVELITPP